MLSPQGRRVGHDLVTGNSQGLLTRHMSHIVSFPPLSVGQNMSQGQPKCNRSKFHLLVGGPAKNFSFSIYHKWKRAGRV